MARRASIILLAAMVAFVACAPASPTATPPSQTAVPTPTPTEEPRPIPVETSTPSPSPSATPSPTATEVPPTYTPTVEVPTGTPTPEGFPQVYVGIPIEAINKAPPYSRCGGFGIWTMDYDPGPGARDFWEVHSELPKPEGFTHRTRDGRRNMDYCTDIGFPITFLQEEGRITQNRTQDGVLDILITKGVGAELTLGFGHVNSDIDPNKPGMQYLTVGSIVHQGDIIAYTGRAGISPGADPSTNIGLLTREGYHPNQEMMLIGPDGQPNILY